MQRNVLAKEDMDLLREVTRKRVPALLATIEHDGIGSLTDHQLGRLIDAVDNEMIEIGFQPDWEPNLHGRRLEALGDILVIARSDLQSEPTSECNHESTE